MLAMKMYCLTSQVNKSPLTMNFLIVSLYLPKNKVLVRNSLVYREFRDVCRVCEDGEYTMIIHDELATHCVIMTKIDSGLKYCLIDASTMKMIMTRIGVFADIYLMLMQATVF